MEVYVLEHGANRGQLTALLSAHSKATGTHPPTRLSVPGVGVMFGGTEWGSLRGALLGDTGRTSIRGGTWVAPH
jgi:hypothetical protein